MSAKVLLLGSGGIVGSEILNKLIDAYIIEHYNHDNLDITNFHLIEKVIKNFKPEFIINCAAYTNVDQAESNEDLCYQINSIAVKHLSEMCRSYNCKLIHLSSDYVFDGVKKSPYTETDTMNPLNIYGKSKSRGDNYIMDSGCSYIIFRTSWVYGQRGRNFVKSILKRSIPNNQLKVICDQYGVPTSSIFIADIINIYLEKCLNSKTIIKNNNIFNLCPSGHTSWHDFANKILYHASKINSKYETDIVSIGSDDLNAPAPRPKFSILSNEKLCTYFDIDIQNWEYYLKQFLDSYIN